MSRTSHDLSDEEAQHIADEVNSLCHWPDKQTPPVFHWPSLTSRRKNEVVHQYVALSEDLLDVPDYLGDANAVLPLLALQGWTGGLSWAWNSHYDLVVHRNDDSQTSVMAEAKTFCEAACLGLLRVKRIEVYE